MNTDKLQELSKAVSRLLRLLVGMAMRILLLLSPTKVRSELSLAVCTDNCSHFMVSALWYHWAIIPFNNAIPGS